MAIVVYSALTATVHTLFYRPDTCENTTFTYDNEFKEYIKVEEAVSENIFDYLFDVGARKFLFEKGKKYLFELFEKWDPEHLQSDEDFDDYPDNDSLEDIIGDEGI